MFYYTSFYILLLILNYVIIISDIIFVFDHGRIIEQGSHQDLLKLKGRYYQLFMLQFQKNELKNIINSNYNHINTNS